MHFSIVFYLTETFNFVCQAKLIQKVKQVLSKMPFLIHLNLKYKLYSWSY